MSDEMLDNYIRSLIEMHKLPQVTVAWQVRPRVDVPPARFPTS
jgi:hypothetical protein